MRSDSYRVFFWLGSSDPGSGLSAVREIFEHTERKSDFFAVGSNAALLRLRDHAPELGIHPLEVPPDTTRAAALALLLRDFCDQDFAFASAGLALPPAWDLRLAWTAQRFPGVATVSPLFSSHFRTAKAAMEAAPGDELDRLFYRHSQFPLIETETVQDLCIFVRGKAVRSAPEPVREATPAKRLGLLVSHWKRLRYSHLIADHLYAVGTGPEIKLMQADAAAALEALGRRVLEAAGRRSPEPAVSQFLRPRVLHVVHSWGGGLERWVREYCRSDCCQDNLVLRSSGDRGAFGSRLVLYKNPDAAEPIEEWPLAPAIKSTEVFHGGYRAALAKIIDHYGVEAIVISSLIGHSLDALRSGLPVVIVCHDYYPFCPALNITFSGVCRSCGPGELAACTAGNPHHRFFRNTPPEQWLELREAFLREISQGRVVLAAPSVSVRDHYQRLAPEMAQQCRVIPHGTRPLPGAPLTLKPDERDADARLRLVVLGSLDRNKGRSLIESIWRELLQFADVLLAGCGPSGRDFAGPPAVTCIPEYCWETLAPLLASFEPDLALLPAVVPETFSLTLQELFELGIPTLASDLGSFHDRIEDGVNGFLCPPEPQAMLARLRQLAADRPALARVHQRLRQTPVRRLSEMLVDYRDLLGICSPSPKAYFCRDSRFPSDPIAAGFSELRWDCGSARSAAFRPSTVRQPVELSWPAQTGYLTYLDLYPTGAAGRLRLFALRLFDHTGKSVWEWDGSAAAFPASAGAAMEEPGCAVLQGGASPLRLPVTFGQLERLRLGGRLELEIEWPAAAAGPSAPRSSSGPELKSPVSREQLALELEHARTRIADLEGSLSWRLSRPLRTLGAAYLKARKSFRKPD